MATNAIEINATAAEIEAAAKAEKWDKAKISNMIYPIGTVIFFASMKTLDAINGFFGTTSAWSYLGSIQSAEGKTVYAYQKIK